MTPARRRSRAAALAAAVAVLTLFGLGPALAQAPEPYSDPPFACTVIDYGTEPPTLPAPADDPLCVRYDKRNITVSTLEVVDFLAAEPGRVGVALAKCSYWQQDHWEVRIGPDTVPIVEWQGSYWYDARTSTAAGILRDLRVLGQPADGATFVEALRTLVGDDTADRLAAFTDDGGGGGLSSGLPEGIGADCATTEPSEPAPSAPPDGRSPRALPTEPANDGTAARASGDRLPATGGAVAMTVPLAAAAVAALLRAGLRRAR